MLSRADSKFGCRIPACESIRAAGAGSNGRCAGRHTFFARQSTPSARRAGRARNAIPQSGGGASVARGGIFARLSTPPWRSGFFGLRDRGDRLDESNTVLTAILTRKPQYPATECPRANAMPLKGGFSAAVGAAKVYREAPIRAVGNARAGDPEYCLRRAGAGCAIARRHRH